MLAREVGTSAIAREAGLSRQTVLRIKDDPAAAEQVLASWKAREGEKRRSLSVSLTALWAVRTVLAFAESFEHHGPIAVEVWCVA